jgi:hypothetical protein
MALTFLDLQNEVKRRGARDQSGTQFDDAIKNIINTSLFRLSREALWRPLRKRTQFSTVASYTGGSGAGSFTNGIANLTITGATFLSNQIAINRRIKLSGDTTYHTIKAITGETTLSMEEGYNGTSTAVGTYEILPQEEYNLPIQAGHRMFMWHEEWGFPFRMIYLPDQDFYEYTWNNTNKNVPSHYRMWGEDMIISQLPSTANVVLSSSDSGDTSKEVTIFGIVSGYPDSETLAADSTDPSSNTATSAKAYDSIERVVKSNSTSGRLTLQDAAQNYTIAVMPVGDITSGIQYSKVQLWPLRDSVFEVQVQYYKDPYRLVNDGDVHELGQDFDEAIILMSVAKIKYESSQKEGANWFILYKDEVASLRKTNVDKIDWFPTLRPPDGSYSEGMARARLHPHLLYRQVGGQYGISFRR